MKCDHCGSPLPPDSVFCPYCGADRGRARSVRPGWFLLSILCIIAATAAGVSLWFQRTSEEEALPETDFSELAGSVLYLELFNREDELIGTASGFLVNDQHTLVTSYHVVQDAWHITVKTVDSDLTVNAIQILAFDETSDLAVLYCFPEVKAEPLTLEDSDTLRQGDAIYAVGYPLGLANTLSDGIVSSRYLNEYGSDIIQITAAISMGNSGGPLLDASGHVVGVVCAYYAFGQNLNLAVASNTLDALLTSEFHRTHLRDWTDRPEMPGLETGDAFEEVFEEKY